MRRIKLEAEDRQKNANGRAKKVKVCNGSKNT